MTDLKDCCRCGDAPAVTKDGFCAHCTWAIPHEAELGFARLRSYLSRWSEFRVWEREHGGVPA